MVRFMGNQILKKYRKAKAAGTVIFLDIIESDFHTQQITKS